MTISKFLKSKFLIILLIFLITTCKSRTENKINYPEEMVKFVQGIATYARDSLNQPYFGIFVQNGESLGMNSDYLSVTNGIGREDIYYGFHGDDEMTPVNVTQAMEMYLDRFLTQGKVVLTIDYATTKTKIDDAYQKSLAKGYIPYVTVRDLNEIVRNGHNPGPINSNDVTNWSDIDHFLYILDFTNFDSPEDAIRAMETTYYDLIIMDYSFDGSEEEKFSPEEINRLKIKPDGKRRKVLAYLSIGEAEDYRYYWQSDWKPGNPDFIVQENPDWPGNYLVKYWSPVWQQIIFDYLEKIVSIGFDGVYLDLVDVYESF